MNLQITMKKMREEKGLTQMELSQKADLGSSTIGDIERGANASTVKTLEKTILLAFKENDLSNDFEKELLLNMMKEILKRNNI